MGEIRSILLGSCIKQTYTLRFIVNYHFQIYVSQISKMENLAKYVWGTKCLKSL